MNKNKKKRKGFNASSMRCPYCGSTVVYRSADGIYHENKKGTMLYVCSNFPECDAYVRVHAGTNIPVGSLANHELRSLRRTAHHYFDQLHLSGYMSKQDAYQWLADLIMAPLSEAHIGIMKLSEERQKKVEENLGLVHKVINDKVHGPYQLGIYSREDLFQIGCIGLCKAAATDKGGNFSTYAYRLIWNQICDALIYSTRRQANEVTYDVTPYTAEVDESDLELGIAIKQALDKAILEAPPSTVKGIEAIRLMADGYTCREIGEQMGASDKVVAAWISKARKFLKARKDVLDLAGNM